MEDQKRQFKKRKKLNLSVKREFQLWLLIRISGVVIVSSLVAVLILYFYARQEISASFYTAHIQIRRVSDLLWPVMAAGALVSLLSGIILALFLPQKIAGPLFRIEKSLDLLRQGDLTDQVKLRKGATLVELADSVNAATEGLRARILEVKGIQRELDQTIVALENQGVAVISARQNNALDRFRT
jgi:methyl-accepting chemotaxis protein